MKYPIVCCVLVLAMLCTTQSSSQEKSPATKGEFVTQFSQESPLANDREYAKRVRSPEKPEPFDITKEQFRVYVPESYDGSSSYGLVAWINAGPTGAVPREPWLKVLDDKKLIWVGADNTGNNRPLSSRIRLAMDGMHNITSQYRIDPNRIYVAGMSGGGRVSSMVAVLYGDVFSGGLYCCGVNFYREIPVPNQKGKVWPQQFYAPVPKILQRDKLTNRYVLLTGDNDMNRENTQAIYESGYKKEGYKNVTYLQVPNMGHNVPEAEWFAKGIDALDEVLTDPKWQATTQPVRKK